METKVTKENPEVIVSVFPDELGQRIREIRFSEPIPFRNKIDKLREVGFFLKFYVENESGLTVEVNESQAFVLLEF